MTSLRGPTAVSSAELTSRLRDRRSTLFSEWLVRHTAVGLSGGLILHTGRWSRFLAHLEAPERPDWLGDLSGTARQSARSGVPLASLLCSLDEEIELILQTAQDAPPELRPALAEARRSGIRALTESYLEAAGVLHSDADQDARVKELEARVSELLILSEVAGLVTTSLSLKDTLDTVARLASRLVGTERASIALRPPGEDHLIMDPEMGHVGTSQEFIRSWRLGVDEGVGGQAFQEQRPIVVEDAHRDSRFDHDLARKEGVRSWIVAPLVAGRESIGLLYALNTHPTRFGPEQVHSLTVLAHYSAVAIQKARVVEDLRQAKSELEAWAAELEARVEARTRELRQAQAQLLRAERQAAIGQLGAGVAHELRNPLGIIKNSAYYVRSKLDGEEKLERHLKIMEKEIARSDRIISALTEFSRSPEPQLQRQPMHHLVAGALEGLQLPEGIELEAQLREVGPVDADAEQLGHAIGSVVENAVQAMSDQGRIQLRLAQAEGWAHLEIIDHGPGIASEDLERVFEPLWTTKTHGIGLGLPLTRARLEAQGGKVGIRSRVGQGTRVTLSLPLAADSPD